MAAIELSGVHKSFGPKHVLNGVNLAVPKGRSLVVIGGSGTGKGAGIGGGEGGGEGGMQLRRRHCIGRHQVEVGHAGSIAALRGAAAPRPLNSPALACGFP